ncbi:MAG: FISUMP domain-containing protein [Bacteroidales bacterium]
MKRFVSAALLIMIAFSLSAQLKLKDQRDGNIYKTYKVQGVIWMAENLRYKAPQGSNYFDKDPTNLRSYGMLYDWKTAMQVCPAGWRLPTGDEFQSLINSKDQEESWKSDKSATPDSFGIQLGGMQDYEGTFTEMEESAYFWTSTEYNKENAQYVSYLIITENPVVDVSRAEDIDDVHGTEKSNKYSVRCIKAR